ncbi:MAG: metalloregulator ArsR/SmtB family transcription factor [Bacteroidia bacterium]
MATTKTEPFSAKQITLASLAKALGHPARIAILQVLIEEKTCICGDIVDRVPLAQATISQHLKVLKDSGLIHGEIAPNRSCYCINPEGWNQAKTLLGDFLSSFDDTTSQNCC